MPEKKPTLGSLLRGLRARLGLTLKDMSERTGIPFSTLSKVEHDRLTLTYDKLQMISERLNVPMAELFSEPGSSQRVEVNGRRSVGALDTAFHVATPIYEYFYLNPELRHKHMIPILSHVYARTLQEFGDLVRHGGEEFIFVVNGKISVHTEFYDPLVLGEGESIYIDSKMGHAYLLAEGVESATILSVCSTSQEELISVHPSLAPAELAAPTYLSVRVPRRVEAQKRKA